MEFGDAALPLVWASGMMSTARLTDMRDHFSEHLDDVLHRGIVVDRMTLKGAPRGRGARSSPWGPARASP